MVVEALVLILDGISEIDAHVRSDLCYKICLRHLIRSGAVTNEIFFPRKDLFSLMRAQHVMSHHANISSMAELPHRAGAAGPRRMSGCQKIRKLAQSAVHNNSRLPRF